MRLFPWLFVAVVAGFAAGAPALSAATKPNIILILADDVGWGDLGCYGGEISTPNLDSLASTGTRFREFYNSARCSPTRCAILTGLYTQQAAVDPAASLPNLRNDNNVTLAELLQANGYRTYMAGKWHLGAGALLPENRGFQHVWRFISGTDHSENQWDITRYTLISQNNEIAARTYTGTGQTFYQTDAVGDYSVDFINHDLNKGDGAPFFIYMAFGAAHFPIGAPAAVANTYSSTYSQGWDVVRQNRYNRQLALGVIDSRYPFPALGGTAPLVDNSEPTVAIPAWNTLASDRQADLARRMSLYAALVQKLDENVGKVIARLQAVGQLDNTLILFASDNGANLEGGRFGTWTGTADSAALTGTALTNMGQAGANDGIRYGGGWAHMSNTPLRLFKHFAHEGGIRAPFIARWPAGFTGQGAWTEEVGHIIDVMPTVVAATGVTYPASYNGHTVLPMQGVSLLPAFQGGTLPARSVFVEHESNRMIRKDKWKLVTKNFLLFDRTSFANERELYDMSLDPGESNNVAYQNPTLVVQLLDEWNAWATAVGLPATRLLTPPPRNVTPGLTSADLFVDTFNRVNNMDTDASAAGMSGSRVPPIGANAAWFEGWEGSGTPDSIMVVDSVLQMATGVGMSEDGVNHNFIGQDILNAGGFSISLRILEINTDPSDAANRYAGFGVGLNATQAAAGNDINTNVSSPRPIRGNTGNLGAAACFVELDLNKNVKVWTKGILRATVPVGATSGNLTAAFALSGFGTADTVTVAVYFNGKRLDLDTSSAGDTLSFTWNQASANYVALSARASNYVQMDNFAVRKLPLANAMAVDYALGKGLDGADAAPTANPDGDRLDNYSEWAFGSDPTLSDDVLSSTLLTFTDLPTQGFRFAHRRLTDYQNLGVAYLYEVSNDLRNWHSVTPSVVSTTALTASPGYEAVELKLPDAELTNQDRLFLRIEVPH